MTRTEVFEASGPTSGTYISVKLGATGEGKLTAASATLIFEAGAFPGSPVAGGAQCMMSAYDIPNAFIEGYDIVVNRPKTSAYRAPGSPAAAFAMETAIDELCEKIGMDPIEFRLLNSSKEGVRRVTGPLMPRVGFIETLEAAKGPSPLLRASGRPLPRPGRCQRILGKQHRSFQRSGPGSAPMARSALPKDRPISAAPALPCLNRWPKCWAFPWEDIASHIGDTDSIGFTSNTGGSGVTFKTGFACYTAAQGHQEADDGARRQAVGSNHR